MKLLFGTAGIPLSTEKRNTANGIRRVRQLGLDAMELEFVHSVNISEEKAPGIRKTAKENGVTLTCHGQYYINLNSTKEKTDASVQRVLNAARRARQCGAWSVCFHAGFYMKENPGKVLEKIRGRIKYISKILSDEGNDIWIRPEISGKPTQFGSLDELITLSDIENVLPCIDFAHMHARTNGKYNTYEEFTSILESLEKIGKEATRNMHAHVAGIEYSGKGERRHLELDKSDMNYKDLVKSWKDFKTGGVVICESPNIEKDALRLKNIYEPAK